jgi:serine O-acetyltransferase
MINLADFVRRSHSLRAVPVVPKILYYLSYLIFNSSVPPSVYLGPRTRFAYGGIGCVIHGDAIIGADVIIGQGVTIGGDGNRKGVPTICDDVYIGAGARLLGPIVVGQGARIGANAVVLSDVPPLATAVGIPAKILLRSE